MLSLATEIDKCSVARPHETDAIQLEAWDFHIPVPWYILMRGWTVVGVSILQFPPPYPHFPTPISQLPSRLSPTSLPQANYSLP